MAIKEFKLGAAVRVRGTFKNPTTGVKFDPTTVKVAYYKAGDSPTIKTYGIDAAVIKEAVGIYYLDINVNAVSTWYWRIYSEGTGQTADEGTFICPPSNFD
jgi:hypothetical protein